MLRLKRSVVREPWELTWRDYYDELGIPEDSSSEDIRLAFRALARIYHPDRLHSETPAQRASAEQRFKLIAEAYDVLQSPTRRAAYDQARARSIYGVPPPPQMTVDPANVSLVSLNGEFVIRSHVTTPPDASVGLLSIECDDGDVQLKGAEVRPCIHGLATTSDATIRASIERTGVRALRLEYAVDEYRASQGVSIRLLPVPLLWLGRVHARFGWPGISALAGVSLLFTQPFISSNRTLSILLFVGALMLIAYALVVGAVHTFTRPRWWAQLRPTSRFAYVVIAIVLINLGRLIWELMFS
jgi:hypothetical protein